MRRSDTNAPARGDRILQLLGESGSVSTEQLCGELGVSLATIRRDLRELENRKLLRRTHGGAMLLGPLLYEAFKHDSTFQEQVERQAEEKRRIGAAAAALINENDTIALTAGTTATAVIRSLGHLSGLTVVTNTVNVAMELTQQKNLNVFVTGGFLRGDWFSLVGAAAMRAMRQICPNKMFIGVNGIDADKGLTCHNPDEAAINRVMVEQSKYRIAIADHTKLGVVASYRFGPIRAVDLLITDTSATDEMVDPFLRKGIEVRCV